MKKTQYEKDVAAATTMVQSMTNVILARSWANSKIVLASDEQIKRLGKHVVKATGNSHNVADRTVYGISLIHDALKAEMEKRGFPL